MPKVATDPWGGPNGGDGHGPCGGNGSAFVKGRDFAAWLGLVPRQHSTGGKAKLLGISQRGNPYLRRLFIHGARAVLTQGRRDQLAFSSWMDQLDYFQPSKILLEGKRRTIHFYMPT